MRTSREWLKVVCAFVLCAVVAAATADAQEKKQDKKPEKKEQQVERPLSVKLGALVLDSQDHPVNDLRQDDFQILEDGVAQKISVFERLEGPHAFGLVVDSSGSMRRELNNVVEFGKMIVAGTGADSESFVVRFVDSDKITIVQDMTANKVALADALDDMYVEAGQTAINDAVYLSAEHMLE